LARQAGRFEGTRMLAKADPSPRSGEAWVRERYGTSAGRTTSLPMAEIGKSLLKAVMGQRPGGTRMSARTYHRILKLAQTMARKAGLDLAGSGEIQTAHLAEVI
jgi:hypothetical protein